MAITLNITASYYDRKGIPPRCRKPQPTFFTVRTSLELKEVPEESFSLAGSIGSTQYFTSTAIEGFYIPVANLADVARLDLSAGGIFADMQDSLGLSADSMKDLVRSLFGLSPARAYDVKIADKDLATAHAGGHRESRILVIPDKELPVSSTSHQPIDAQALDYLKERAEQLVIGGKTVFRRIPEPRLIVEVNDRDDKYLAAWNLPNYLRPPVEQCGIKPNFTLSTNPQQGNRSTAPVFDYQVRPLTDIPAILEQLTDEMRSLDVDERCLERVEEQAQKLGVTIYNPDAFTPATAAFPSRLVRISRLRAGVILDALQESYGSKTHDHYGGTQKPIPADVLAGLLAELQELTKTLAGLGEPLFMPAERMVSLR